MEITLIFSKKLRNFQEKITALTFGLQQFNFSAQRYGPLAMLLNIPPTATFYMPVRLFFDI